MDVNITPDELVNEMQTRYPKEITICFQALQIQKLQTILQTEEKKTVEQFDYEYDNGDSQYQFGDEIEATTDQAEDAVASGDLLAV